jgi:hypothetical protein
VYANKAKVINLNAPSASFTVATVSGNSIVSDSRYKEEITYKVEYGNSIEVTKKEGVVTSYLWDHNKNYTVAKVENTTIDKIAYSSFETAYTGNWTYSGLAFTDGSAPTGKKVYSVTTGNITKSGLNTTLSYIVSYWTKNALAFSITGTQSGFPIAGRSINGWSYFEHKISGLSLITIGGSGLIDELRLYPADALMTTMTYIPAVGMSSKCNVNNQISYHEYDEFNRLILIRDQDKNVIKKVCYNYNGQTENCNIHYNSPQSGNFTKACTGGETGSVVSYPIPANTYSSTISPTDANNKALADIQANGQSYANAIGICTPPLITIQGYNTKTSTYQVKFTNNATLTEYTFYLNPNTFSAYILGQVPSGTYKVQFSPAGSPVWATHNINSFTQYAQFGATFYNISITATSTASMY